MSFTLEGLTTLSTSTIYVIGMYKDSFDVGSIGLGWNLINPPILMDRIIMHFKTILVCHVATV